MIVDMPLIGTGNLTRDALAGQVAVVTGAGRGIGVEAARALAWLGARVVVAEIDARAGRETAARIAAEMGAGSAVCIQTDVGDEKSVARLARRVGRIFGPVDIVPSPSAPASSPPPPSRRPSRSWRRSTARPSRNSWK